MTYQQALDLIQAEIIANGNNEITANVLRPVLEAMIDFPNDVIGALADLNTSDITSIVNAINSIVAENLPNATALRPIDTTGVDFDQEELLWVRDAINNTATNNGAFTCSLGQQMVFYSDVLLSNDGDTVTYQTRYYRLTTGAIIVNSLGTGSNPPLMPDGSTINTLDLNSDLVIDLGNIGTDNVEDAFNSDGDQPFTIIGDKFVQAIQNGNNKLWQWIGGNGTFGNSATLALASYFVDLTSTTPPPSSIPKYEQIKGGAVYQSLTATPSIELNLNSFFYRYITTDDDLEITFSNLPAPDYGFPRFIDLVIPATKVLTIPSADEIVGSVVADGTTVNRIELRFVYYPTVGLRIIALINGGASSTIPNEEQITGTALYSATTTGAVDIDCATFTSWYRILTGNSTLTFTNTPASGFSFTRFLTIKSTASETLAFGNATYVVGTFANDTSENFITVELSNFPTVGLQITVFINQV